MCCSFADRVRRTAFLALVAAALLATGPAAAQAPLRVVETAAAEGSLAITVSATAVRRVIVDGPEVLVQFARPIDPGDIEEFARRRADWLDTVEYGYDSLVIRFLPELKVTATAGDAGVAIQAERPGSAAAVESGPVDPQLVRLDYYRALILMESGSVRQGRALLVDLHRADPRNVEVILLLAQAEERLGRRERTIALLDKALELDPGLGQAALDKSRLHREIADRARLSLRAQSVADADDQRMAVLDGTLGLWPGTTFEYRLENRHLKIDEARRSDGSLSAFDGERQFATFRLVAPPADDLLLGYSLFAANNSAGIGLDMTAFRGPSEWRLEGAVGQPEKNYVEGLIDGATRDRIGIALQHRPNDVVELRAGTAVNRYAIDHEYAGSGLELTGEARHTVYAPWPFLTVGYRLDAEYFTTAETATAADGTVFDRLPLSSREAHTVDAGLEGMVTDYLRARAVGGYTVDRLNGHGPSAELELTYEPLPDLEIVAGMGTSLAVARGTQSQLIFGGLSIRTRF